MKRSLLITCMLFMLLIFMTGCGNQLSKQEIARANEAFTHTVVTGNHAETSEISCFFTCYYDDPREIDLWKFLYNCPLQVRLTYGDEQEFFDWLDATDGYLEGVTWQSPEEYFVPVWRYTKDSVSALLTRYAGITADDLNSWGNALYLEKYDAFYNCSSDVRSGRFACVGGEKDGAIIRFWSETDQEGMREVLTVEKVDETYLIRSFLREKAK